MTTNRPFLGGRRVTCRECGKTYICTPESDYYNFTNAEDGVCEKCFLSQHNIEEIIGEIEVETEEQAKAGWNRMSQSEKENEAKNRRYNMKNLNEKDGIKAIQFLQGMVNIEETEEQARAGWNGMSQSEKENTMKAYEIFKSRNN